MPSFLEGFLWKQLFSLWINISSLDIRVHSRKVRGEQQLVVSSPPPPPKLELFFLPFPSFECGKKSFFFISVRLSHRKCLPAQCSRAFPEGRETQKKCIGFGEEFELQILGGGAWREREQQSLICRGKRERGIVLKSLAYILPHIWGWSYEHN